MTVKPPLRRHTSRFKYGDTCGRQGLTLLETLLAVFLTSMLVVLIGAAVNFYIRFVNERHTGVIEAQVARAVLRRFSDDLRGAFYAKPEQEGTLGADVATDTTSAGDDGTADSTDQAALDSATVDLTASPAQPTPGLYGNQYQLQVDVRRDPRPQQYDALVSAGIDPRLANIGADLKTISYYTRALQAEDSIGPQVGAATTRVEQSDVLVRRVVSRAVALTTSALGDTNASTQGEQVLAEDVMAVEFEYFDGLQWWPDWDSSLQGGLPMAVSISVIVRPADGTQADSPTDSASVAMDQLYKLTVNIPTAQPTYEDTTSTDSTGL